MKEGRERREEKHQGIHANTNKLLLSLKKHLLLL